MKVIKLIKNKCEIESCNVVDPKLLDLHHIIERTEENTTNNPFNLAILCKNCHALSHTDRLKIIGPYPSTRLPNKRTLVYILDGISNMPGIDKPYITFTNKSYQIFGDKNE